MAVPTARIADQRNRANREAENATAARHPDIMKAQSLLAAVLLERGQVQRAEPLLLEAEQRLSELALSLADRKTPRRLLVQLYQRTGQSAEAARYSDKAVPERNEMSPR